VLARLGEPELPAAAGEHGAKQAHGLRGRAVKRQFVPGRVGLGEPGERHAGPGTSGGVASEVITDMQHPVAADVKSLAGLAEKRPGPLPEPCISRAEHISGRQRALVEAVPDEGSTVRCVGEIGDRNAGRLGEQGIGAGIRPKASHLQVFFKRDRPPLLLLGPAKVRADPRVHVDQRDVLARFPGSRLIFRAAAKPDEFRGARHTRQLISDFLAQQVPQRFLRYKITDQARVEYIER